ncbi:hypothetical protein pEaSNUABM37_00327 [Erwinia phage pEa_SNUABM_37]|nr:hypothetical protein pEaSNUABM37_00327 [Erwinia phage pEa_SNUABM_37]QXO10795.1 hypothetical protein pEaSNUABM48_00327 [Erwinia phage pEa_SNUABM_48]
MSLEMITTYMQPNGAVPKSAFTVVKKPNDDIEIVTESQDKAINASLEHIGNLINLHNRIASEGMSRAAVAELKEIAPSAVPGGYGLEAFTELPTDVMLDEGLEGIVGQTLAALQKLIKFLIEKLKAGFNVLMDSYKVLTGISPSAYKLSKQKAYTEAITKNWRTIMGSDLDTVVLEALQKDGNNELGAQLILDGFWNDANGICDNLGTFEPLVSQLQRAVEDMILESSNNQATYNRVWESLQRGKPTEDEYRDAALKISNLIDTPHFQRISKLIEQFSKKVLESKLYKPDDKTGKAIVDRLRSDKFRDVLIGLQDACRVSKPLCLKPAEAFAVAKQQDFDAMVDQLKLFDPVEPKTARELKQQLDALRVYDRYVSIDMSDEKGFEVMSTEFLSQQNDVKAVVDVVRDITANYAETVFKIAAFRDKVRMLKVPRMVATTPDELAMEANEERMDKIRAAVKQWITNATKV